MRERELDSGDKHLLRLIRKDADAEGWVPVSNIVFPAVDRLPKALVEIGGEPNNWKARLTEAGNTVVDWMC